MITLFLTTLVGSSAMPEWLIDRAQASRRSAGRCDDHDFLPDSAGSIARQVSVETAQPNLDPAELDALTGKHIMVGVLDLADPTVETPEKVAARIRRAMTRVPVDRIIVAPDCGLKYLPREIAYGKMKAMVEGAAIVRGELAS